MTRTRAAFSKSLLAVLLLAAGTLAAAAQTKPPAEDQGSGMPNALQGFARNRSEPVKIDANRLEVHDKEKLAIFSGNVFVQQGDTNMRCPELRVFYEGEVAKGAGPAGDKSAAAKPSDAKPSDAKSSDAKPGDAKPAAASAAKASTTENNVQQRIKRLEALGGVIVTSKDQKATGDRADFDMKANVVTLFGNVVVTQGPNVMKGDRLIVDLSTSRARMEAGTKGNPGRVQGLFVPSSGKEGSTEPKKGKPKTPTEQTPSQ
jgi:lipopolysaccharide export system protein LptA